MNLFIPQTCRYWPVTTHLSIDWTRLIDFSSGIAGWLIVPRAIIRLHKWSNTCYPPVVRSRNETVMKPWRNANVSFGNRRVVVFQIGKPLKISPIGESIILKVRFERKNAVTGPPPMQPLSFPRFLVLEMVISNSDLGKSYQIHFKN